MPAEGEAPIALMARAGHKSMARTNRYNDLAGVTFPDEAEALETRMLEGRKFYPSEPISMIWPHPKPLKQAA